METTVPTALSRGLKVAAQAASFSAVGAFLYGITKFPGSSFALTLVAPALVLIAPLLGVICLLKSRADTGRVSLSARRTFIFSLVPAAGVGLGLLFLAWILSKLTF